MIYILVAVVFAIRLLFLKVSKQNELNILKEGGKEYGARNTKFLTLFHVLFYLFSVIEAILVAKSFDAISFVGMLLLMFSMTMLYTVTRLLGRIWTVKLMLLHQHEYVDHWIFRKIKHPNYFLNIVPELIGLCLLCHSKWTFLCLAPCYAIPLYFRIKEEEILLTEVIILNSKK